MTPKHSSQCAKQSNAGILCSCKKGEDALSVLLWNEPQHSEKKPRCAQDAAIWVKEGKEVLISEGMCEKLDASEKGTVCWGKRQEGNFATNPLEFQALLNVVVVNK